MVFRPLIYFSKRLLQLVFVVNPRVYEIIVEHARNFGYDVTYVRSPSARTDCRSGGGEEGEPLGTGVFGQFSLAGNGVQALRLATRVFLAANHISDKQRDKEQESKRKAKNHVFERRG